MRKFILTFTLIVSVFVGLNAQVDGKAIGLRFGGFDGSGAEVSYQHPLGKVNRLEVDLGVNHYGFGLGGVYQWVWDLSDLAPGFNWYAGVGASLGSYDFNDTKHDFGIGALGKLALNTTSIFLCKYR